ELVDPSVDLAAEGNAGSSSKTIGFDIVVELLLPELIDRDLGCADVRRLGDDILDGQQSVAAVIVVQRTPHKVPEAVFTIDRVVERHQILVQGRRNDHNFEG